MVASVGELWIFGSISAPNLSGYSSLRLRSVEKVVAKGPRPLDTLSGCRDFAAQSGLVHRKMIGLVPACEA
jgi:hypothetical protein